VQGQISLLNQGILSFGLEHYASSEFEVLAEELLMSDSVIRVSGNCACLASFVPLTLKKPPFLSHHAF